MSSRQTRRLKNNLELQGVKSSLRKVDDDNDKNEDNSSSEDDVNDIIVVKNSFAFSDSESESEPDEASSPSDDESEQNETKLKPDVIAPNKKKFSKPQAKIKNDINPAIVNTTDDINLILAEHTSQQSSLVLQFNALFKIQDEKALDVDALMRKRFGSKVISTVGTNTTTNHKSKSSSSSSYRKYIFGGQKEDWVKPPSYIAGGYAVVKCDPPLAFQTQPSHDTDAAATITSTDTTDFFSILSVLETATSASTSLSSASSTLSLAPAEKSSCIWYKIIWSEEYTNLNKEYQIVINSGDANRLVMFLSQTPYHVEGLVQLGMIFARSGSMDRASDLIKRALFCLETSFSEGFSLINNGSSSGSSSGNSSTNTGFSCRMDVHDEKNIILFTTLFRYMQMSCMLGFPSLAADIGLIILGLFPYEDVYHVLLTLEYYLVASLRVPQLLLFSGINLEGCTKSSTTINRNTNTNNNSNGTSSNSNSSSFTNQWAHQQHEWYDYLTTEWSSPLTALISTTSDDQNNEFTNNIPSFNLSSLPNWWFSSALGIFNTVNKKVPDSTLNSNKNQTVPSFPTAATNAQISQWIASDTSTKILKTALMKFPFMLKPLMKKANIEGKSIVWRSVLAHPLFADAEKRLLTIISSSLSQSSNNGNNNNNNNNNNNKINNNTNHVDKQKLANCYLQLANIYATRNGSLWNREEVQQWLVRTCESLVLDADTTQTGVERNIIAQYSSSSSNISNNNTISSLFMSTSSTDVKDNQQQPQTQSDQLIHHHHQQQLQALHQYYSTALLEDFLEDYPRLPAEANPLDPHFADPRILDRRVIQQQHRAAVAGVNGGNGGGGRRRGGNNNNNNGMNNNNNGMNNNEMLHNIHELEQQIQQLMNLNVEVPQDLIAELHLAQQQLQLQQQQGREQRGENGNGIVQGNIDYNAPLLQLFWQTLLPFYHIGTADAQANNNNNR